MEEVITLGIVEDQVLLRSTLRDFLGKVGFAVAFEVGSANEMINELEKSIAPPNIILIDIKLRDHNGMTAVQYVTQHYPAIMPVAFSMLKCIDAIADMLEAGAVGFISKTVDPLQVVEGLKAVYKGDHIVMDPVNDWTYQSLLRHLNQREKLNDRERSFLKLCSSELTYKEIAAKLCTSPKTIDKYRESVFKKLSVKSRSGLVRYAIQNGLIE